MRNALQFDLHNGGSPMPPAYALKVGVGTSQYTAYLDPTTGRPDTQIETVTYELVEIVATDKPVVNDMAVARVDYDIRAHSSVSPASVRGAMQKTARSKSSPMRSATDLHRTS